MAKVEKWFQKFDADQNESLSKDEVTSLKALTKRFDKIDADQNNSLSRDGVTQFMVALEERKLAKNN